jgi:lipopolysaccharide export system protein LptA
MTLHDDVLVREIGKPSQRYGTGGRADFESQRNVIVLREFPQVYQDRDTVTGDVIIVHRDTDIVEVEHSNAFSEGDTRKQQ